MNNKNISIVEYGFLHCNEKYKQDGKNTLGKAVFIEKKIFLDLETFVLENNSTKSEFLKISHKKQYGKILQAQQYAGVLQGKDGTTIEILPKITNLSSSNDEERKKSISENKKLFLKMLKHLKNAPYKNIIPAHLDTQKHFPLLEIFISIFCNDISHLIKTGIQSEYNLKQENSFFLKGKLLFQKHISHNFIHKEKFFIQHDEFSQNRAENRILKSTLQFLVQHSKSQKNIAQLQEYLFVFEHIPASKNIQNDFSAITLSRSMKHYEQPLQWAKIFLNSTHITPNAGACITSAILFDMNKVFEDYVAYCLKKSGEYTAVHTQIKGQYLIEFPEKKFALRPDLFLKKQINHCTLEIIADTKWKKIFDMKSISQSDIYQMFAYAKKYKINRILLIYPYHSDIHESMKHRKKIYFDAEKQISLEITFFDIDNNIFL